LTTKKSSILIFIALLIISNNAFASWKLIPPTAKNNYASSAYMDLTLYSKTYEYAALIIEFTPQRNCKPSVGVMFIKPGGKGRPLSSGFKEGENAEMTIDGRKFSAPTYIIEYENAFEITTFANQTVVNLIKKAESVEFIYNNKLGVVFQKAANTSNITTAQNNCNPQ
jgi:hypothetical protein